MMQPLQSQQFQKAPFSPLQILDSCPSTPKPQQLEYITPPQSIDYHLLAEDAKKRVQVKKACANCQKSCKKCDEIRPCQRCIRLGEEASCIDTVRKERRKGTKRGPYKKKSLDFESALRAPKKFKSLPVEYMKFNGHHFENFQNSELFSETFIKKEKIDMIESNGEYYRFDNYYEEEGGEQKLKILSEICNLELFNNIEERKYQKIENEVTTFKPAYLFSSNNTFSFNDVGCDDGTDIDTTNFAASPKANKGFEELINAVNAFKGD
ncbi:hypothetical protein HK099_007592 [Clydaea vesicula]|uniref:Zn(2)-C6 fungal-type domain-containing protein n=1 Tax=Clydaea vesicula TaxID=447962 RepID=A0AAD5U5B5_9FUNG|nr:hypothetical protein HK099_007592 [Clydaea vesicula]KAJ3397786.1 hypothetical protein HDU92_002458 [Lobulomyces angularis]